MKRKLLSLLMILALTLSCCSVAFAASGDDGIQPRDTASMTYALDRESGTKGSCTANITFATQVDSYTVTFYLQKLSNDSWINDTSNEDYKYSTSGVNKRSTLVSKNYDDLAYGKSYRVKIVSVDYIDGVKYQSTGYTTSF